jgi:hypothetical protein
MVTYPLISFSSHTRLKTVTFLVWCCAAASIGFWCVHLMSQYSEDIVHDLTSSETVMVSGGHVEVALGKSEHSHIALPKINKFRVLGLISSSTGYGSALISINGEPATAFKAGQVVSDDWILYFVAPHGIKLKNKNSFQEHEIQMPIRTP